MIELLPLIVTSLSDKILVDGLDLIGAIWTPIIYTLLATFVLYKGTTLECWHQQLWSNAQVGYAEAYCYIAPVFPVPDTIEMIEEADLYHYRQRATNWHGHVFVTCFAAIFVTIAPKLLYDTTQKCIDLSLEMFLTHAKTISKIVNEEERKEEISKLAEELQMKLYSREYTSSFPSPVVMFFGTKIIYLLLAIAQFVAIPHFLQLGGDYWWSFKMLRDRVNGVSREEIGVFPDMIMCEFSVRTMAGYTAEHMVQCLMKNNIFYEIILIGLSFWHMASAFVITLGIILARRAIFTRNLVESILVGSGLCNESKADLKEFSAKLFGNEGKFVIYLMNQKNPTVTKELIVKLYEDFKKFKQLITTTPENVLTEESSEVVQSPV